MGNDPEEYRVGRGEGRTHLEQFIQHTTEREPVGRRIVGYPFGQDFGGHVAVGTAEKGGVSQGGGRTTYTEAWGFFLEKSQANPRSETLT